MREHLLGNTCEIAELLVSEPARGRGLGASLLAARLTEERCAWLCTQPDAGALPFYLARAGRPAARRCCRPCCAAAPGPPLQFDRGNTRHRSTRISFC